MLVLSFSIIIGNSISTSICMSIRIEFVLECEMLIHGDDCWEVEMGICATLWPGVERWVREQKVIPLVFINQPPVLELKHLVLMQYWDDNRTPTYFINHQIVQ